MNHLKAALVPPIIASVVLFGACDGLTRTVVSDFPIPVDDVDVPSTIAVNEPLPVRVMGVIGNSTCHSFLRFDVAWSEERDEVLVIPMGRYEAGRERCQPVTALLDEEIVLEPPFHEGELGVNVPTIFEGETARYPVTVVAYDDG